MLRSGRIKARHPPFDSPRRELSNELMIVPIAFELTKLSLFENMLSFYVRRDCAQLRRARRVFRAVLALLDLGSHGQVSYLTIRDTLCGCALTGNQQNDPPSSGNSLNCNCATGKCQAAPRRGQAKPLWASQGPLIGHPPLNSSLWRTPTERTCGFDSRVSQHTKKQPVIGL